MPAQAARDLLGHRRGRERSAAARPATRGSSRPQVRRQRGAPALQLEGGAERALDARERLGVDPDRRRQHRHVAGQRLEHGQPEALALGRHEHGVGGVHPQRHALGLDASEREQLGAGCARRAPAARSWRFSARAGSAGNSRQRPPRLEPQLGARLARGAAGGSARCRRRRGAPRAGARPGPGISPRQRRRDGRRRGRSGAARPRSPGACGGRRGRCRASSAPAPGRARPARARRSGRSGRARRRSGPRRPAAGPTAAPSGGAARRPRAQRAGAGRELVQLDLEPVEPRSAATWSRTKRPRAGWAASGSMLETTSARTIPRP